MGDESERKAQEPGSGSAGGTPSPSAHDTQVLMRTSGGWTQIPRTVSKGQYVSAMLALNLTCPEGGMGDWCCRSHYFVGDFSVYS